MVEEGREGRREERDGREGGREAHVHVLGASVSHTHGEALLRASSAISIVTIELLVVTLKRKLN